MKDISYLLKSEQKLFFIHEAPMRPVIIQVSLWI